MIFMEPSSLGGEYHSGVPEVRASNFGFVTGVESVFAHGQAWPLVVSYWPIRCATPVAPTLMPQYSRWPP